MPGRVSLVRAYSGALIQGLGRVESMTMEYFWRRRITLDYGYYGNSQSKCLPHLSG